MIEKIYPPHNPSYRPHIRGSPLIKNRVSLEKKNSIFQFVPILNSDHVTEKHLNSPTQVLFKNVPYFLFGYKRNKQ